MTDVPGPIPVDQEPGKQLGRYPGHRRSTTEAIALMFAATVALVVLATAIAVGVTMTNQDDPPVTEVLSALGTVISTMLGALLVYVAGWRRKDS